MKILIISDSHLHDEVILSILDAEQPDTVLFLGDYGNKINPAFESFIAVKGNNDFADLPKELVYEYDGHKAFMTHGHFYDVESGLDEIVKRGKELEVDTIIYGHTHQPVDVTIDGIHVINPGSVMFPRNGKILVPTYCVYENGTYTFHNAKNKEVLDIHEEKPQESILSKLKKLLKK